MGLAAVATGLGRLSMGFSVATGRGARGFTSLGARLGSTFILSLISTEARRGRVGLGPPKRESARRALPALFSLDESSALFERFIGKFWVS